MRPWQHLDPFPAGCGRVVRARGSGSGDLPAARPGRCSARTRAWSMSLPANATSAFRVAVSAARPACGTAASRSPASASWRLAAAHRVASTAAWASFRCTAARAAAALAPGGIWAMRRSPTSIASSTRPASARPSTRPMSASARCSRSLSSSTARRSVSMEVASAPRFSADRPDASSRPPARSWSPAWRARFAARSPGFPGQPRVSRLQGRERAGGEGDPPGRE